MGGPLPPRSSFPNPSTHPIHPSPYQGEVRWGSRCLPSISPALKKHRTLHCYKDLLNYPRVPCPPRTAARTMNEELRG